MAREINVEEAASWGDEEAQLNIQYLETRARYPELARIAELRGVSAPAEESESNLMALTKAELLSMAETQGVDAGDSMTKAEIIELLTA